MPADPAAPPDKRGARIAGMFDAIAPRYDLLNHLLSAGIDRRWRTMAIASLRLGGRDILVDVCTGTADIAIGAAAAGARVVGVDFAGAMLAVGRGKVQEQGLGARVALVRGDAMQLPVRSASADAAAVAFGIRNVEDPAVACREMARVLRPGGRLAVLEFGMPRVPGLSRLYRMYFTQVLPRLGRLVSGHTAAYSYLPASVGAFPPPHAFMDLLRDAGFAEVQARPLTVGIVQLYTGVRRGGGQKP